MLCLQSLYSADINGGNKWREVFRIFKCFQDAMCKNNLYPRMANLILPTKTMMLLYGRIFVRLYQTRVHKYQQPNFLTPEKYEIAWQLFTSSDNSNHVLYLHRTGASIH